MQMSSLYTSMSGLEDVNAQLQAVASNIANANTPGYAAMQAVAEAAPYEGANAPPGGAVVAAVPGPDLTQGRMNQTGDTLDVGLSGDSWLTVQTAGGTALTRDGALSISNAGILTDSAGNPVLSTTGSPISLPQLTSLKIGEDGTISGVVAGSSSGLSQQFGQIAMVSTPGGTLTPMGNSLYLPPTGAALTPAANGALHQGYLNDSNVDPTAAMMQMISDSRSYELQAQLTKSQTSASADLNSLLAQG
ncbi:MAG TPA: flagellar hook-basal body complex protein [Acidocella sp.]|nr:flagellar hook-basal body complex protein [Acidocella sp.]